MLDPVFGLLEQSTLFLVWAKEICLSVVYSNLNKRLLVEIRCHRYRLYRLLTNVYKYSIVNESFVYCIVHNLSDMEHCAEINFGFSRIQQWTLAWLS